MKKLILLLTLVLGSAAYKVANAQVGITVNIGSQPVWGPAGYDYAQYYYFPDMDVYYNVPDRQFVYCDRGNWISTYSLPAYYSNYDLYNTYKVVINEPRPYMRNNYWRTRYVSYRGRRQETIFNSRDTRYFVINEHPEHARWIAARNNRGFYDNRPGNFGRNDNHRIDDRRFNNQRPYEATRNEGIRNERSRNDNFSRGNDNRRWNQNGQGGNDNGRFGGRRN